MESDELSKQQSLLYWYSGYCTPNPSRWKTDFVGFFFSDWNKTSEKTIDEAINQ